ncbi:MAG TPA: DUF2804 family protein [Solirubrobacteraceae bacterium]|nr:DUF2804 family protein [Solirubrobacteraceae bacterium]
MNGPLPWRGPGPGRPTNIPLPPERMPLRRGRRPLKQWRYVGVYDEQLMLCAGVVKIGPLRQSFWAIWDRRAQELRERTVRHRGPVQLDPGSLLIDDAGIRVELALEEGEGIEVVCPSERQYTWTRKQACVPARGSVQIAGVKRALDAVGVIDDSAGYHPRHTAWRWSAGVGTAVDGRAVGWNLVAGINDPPTNSERALWLDGDARELGPVTFADSLDAVAFAEGGELRFDAEAVRERDDNMLFVVRSSYSQPFGTFSGALPGGVELREGFGVMERHDVAW